MVQPSQPHAGAMALSRAEPVLLAAAAAAPLLPPPWSLLWILTVGALWVGRRPPARELTVGGGALAVALLMLAAAWISEVTAPAGEDAWVRAARVHYRSIWEGLERQAERAKRQLQTPEGDAEGRLQAFRQLAALGGAGGKTGASLILLNPDQQAVAWAGEGLLHEVEGRLGTQQDRTYVASYGAVSLLAVQPLNQENRAWVVVAGRSFPTYELPFKPPAGRPAAAFRWSLDRAGSRAVGEARAVPLKNSPTLIVRQSATPEATGKALWGTAGAWVAIGLGLLGVAAMRGVGLLLAQRPVSVLEGLEVAVAAAAGSASWCLAAGVPVGPIVLLAAGIGLLALGLTAPRVLAGGHRQAGLLGAMSLVLLVALGWLLQRFGLHADLGSGPWGSEAAVCLRAAWSIVALGLFFLAGRVTGDRGSLASVWAWLAAGLVVLGAAAHDFPWIGLPLLAGGASLVAAWIDPRRLAAGTAPVAASMLLVVLTAAAAWEMGYRLELVRRLDTDLLDQMAPPSTPEVERLRQELRSFFLKLDLAGLLPRSLGGVEEQDLAFTLWRESPLARSNSLSALVFVPFRGVPSGFSFGMPLGDEVRIDLGQSEWEELLIPGWERALISDEAILSHDGLPVGVLRYWFLPRPGFRFASGLAAGEIAAGLLKGGPAAPGRVEGLPGSVVYALYDRRGRALVAPWEEAPPMPEVLGSRSRQMATVDLPRQRARALAREGLDGWQVLYLPVLDASHAAERVGAHAMGSLLVAALAVLVVVVLALPRAAFRNALGLTVRSYSKRLLVLYTVLLLLPLLFLNIVLLGSAEDRLRRAQRANGERALRSAQRFLGEQVLALPPGFGLDTALNQDLLLRLSRVVQHQVNLYWGSSVYASSNRELFTAGLLPSMIPGESYYRLALVGYALSTRTNHAGHTAYLELYAPLRVPGVEAEEDRLFLSMPLLAREEEVAAALEKLRLRALLATATLFVLLISVGSRLARSFTAPLMEIVEGTRDIGAGARSLGLAPRDVELRALATAIDDMARHIAEGREKLVREKQVVDRIVENITSGVISLDQDGRVLMRNRVADDLLGVAVGEPLLDRLSRSDRWQPLTDLLETVHGEMAHQTVRLVDAQGEEREWTLVWIPLPGEGEPSSLLVVEDATEVLRGQRLAAWAEMARIIAHEIKNPLTPIRLSTDHMRQVRSSDPAHFDEVFERCTENILRQVDELRQIAADFSTYSSLPRLELRSGDLVTVMAELVESYRAAPPAGVGVDFQPAVSKLRTRFDAKLLSRAVRNLLENAVRASSGGGNVVVEVESGDGQARIAVADSGPGVPSELLPRIFDPSFSTYDSGTGLGLPIARRIVEDHGGSIVARNRRGGGLEVVITIPVQ